MLSPSSSTASPKAKRDVLETPPTPRRTPVRLPSRPPPQTLATPPPSCPPSASTTSSVRSRVGKQSSPSPLRLRPPRPQQEPDADDYLDNLLWLSRCANLRNPTPAMVDFLRSFNLGPETPAPSDTQACDSSNELQLRLQAILEAKTTPTRAEHVSTTLELRPTAQFTLNLSEPENDALEGLNNVDPSLGGVRSASLAAEHLGGQPLRIVTASETLTSQPQDDPVLQRSVAKSIIGAVSAVDGSAWTVRNVSRDAQGWSFTYVCKDSFQQWSRQHSKSPFKAVIGEYSQREPDPYLANRPAFDCRGSITIAFSRNSRSITVQYDHTPLHKTVAELTEIFKPPSRQLGPGAVAQQQKTPKKSNTDGKKKARDSTNLDENGNPKKTSRKRNLDENGNPKPPRNRKLDENGNPNPPRKRKLDENGNTITRKKKKKNSGETLMPPDYPGAPPLEGTTQADPLYTGQQSTDGAQGFGDYPQGLMGDTASQAQANAANSASFPVNVSPAEAARRREVARGMLKDAGVDPETLSAEQFSIFANQSPDLQKESLSMLAKYGAERLRIVHPSNRESSASVPASALATPVQATQPTPSGPMTTKELVPQDSGPKKGSRKMKPAADANGATVGEVADGQAETETPTKASRSRGGKSRVACYQCKDRKVKCPHEKPACAECEAAGIACEYPPQKPRNRKPKSDAVISIEDDEEEESDLAQDPEPDQTQQNDETHHGAPDYSSYTQMPVADFLTPNVEAPEAQSQPAYLQRPSGLVLPQPDLPRMSEMALSSASGLILPPGRNYDSTQQPASTVAPTQPHEPSVTETASPKQSKGRARISAGDRRGLPGGPAQQPQGSPVVNPSGTAGWRGVNNVPPRAAPANTTLTMQQQQPARNQPRGSVNKPANDSMDAREGIRQAAALSQAAVHRQQSPSVAAATQSQARASPFQAADNPRSKSRQSQRAQSRTPHGGQSKARDFQTPTAPPPHPQATHDATTRQVAAGLTEMAGYNNYGRFPEAGAAADTSSNRIAYEPYAHQKSAADGSSYPSFDYSRNTASTMSMQGQSTTKMAPSYSNNAHSESWMSSQHRDHGQGSYGEDSNTSETPAAMQNFNLRTANQSSRSDLGSLNQRNQQPQGYNAYSSQPPAQQQQNQGQAASQPPGWYNFNGLPESSSSRYNWKMQDQSWSGMS